jgi:hypothetical protein
MKIYFGEEATIGTTSVSLRGSGDDIVITVGKVEVPWRELIFSSGMRMVRK